jgi:hypothetical protein
VRPKQNRLDDCVLRRDEILVNAFGMLDTSHAELQDLFVHRVGNKLRQEGVRFSDAPLRLTELETKPLLYYFFNHFAKSERTFRLAHPVGLAQNATFAISSRLFKGAPIAEESKKAAEHLYDVSDHPKIGAGNLFVAYFRNLKFEEKTCDAVGFFKSDHAEQFLNIDIARGKPELSLHSGMRVKSFDKGALILNRKPSDGFRVLQAVSHSDESAFWIDKFLKTEEVASDSTYTRNLLRVCKDYSESVSDEDVTTKVQFLENAHAYLTDNSQFSEKGFLASLPPENRASFSEFSKKAQTESELRIPSDFAITPAVVKKQKNVFRALITLDDQIEIKIKPTISKQHTTMEKGYDQKLKKNFYKFYYTVET